MTGLKRKTIMEIMSIIKKIREKLGYILVTSY